MKIDFYTKQETNFFKGILKALSIPYKLEEDKPGTIAHDIFEISDNLTQTEKTALSSCLKVNFERNKY